MTATTALRDASTVLLLSDSPDGLQVFMVVRHSNMDFASGALVFPGGSVDNTDSSDALRAHLPAVSNEWSNRERAWRVAAVREVYEEAGVLLARSPAGPISSEQLSSLNRRFEKSRRAGDIDISQVVVEDNLVLACDELHAFAHWITPEIRPKRFDTRFYLARVPDDQVAIHDGQESVNSVWGAPGDILAQADAGQWKLRFPTRVTLEKLSTVDSVAAAITLAQTSNVIPVISKFTSDAGRRFIEIPEAAGFGFCKALLDDDGNIIDRW